MATRTWRILSVFVFFIFLIPFSLLSQDSRFEVFLRKSDNSPQTGATVYAQNLASSTQYTLSEVVGAPGLYRRDNVPVGVYAVYVNGALKTTNRFHGTNRIYLTLTQIDPDANYQIDTQGLEDQSVTTSKLADSSVTQAKVSTALLNLIGSGGAITNNPDDITLENKADSTIGLKENYAVAANIAALESWSKHDLEIGDVVYLREVTSGQGGGHFVLADSATMRSKYGAGIIADTVSFQSGTATKRWFRTEMIESKILRPEWFGAVMDGSTDDAPEIRAVRNHHFATNFPIIGGAGTYKLDSAIDITNPGSGTSAKEGFVFKGQLGIPTSTGTTTWLFASGVSPAIILDGSTIAGARVYSTVIENLTVKSAAADADTGMYINDATTLTFKEFVFDNWKLGILVVDSDNIYAHHFTAGGGDFGMHLSTNANGNTFVECAFTGNDSVGVRLSSNYGNIFVGGDRGNQPISFEGVTTTVFDVYGGNFESHDSAAFVINTNSTVNIHGSRFLEGSPSGVIGYLHNTTHMNLYGITFSGWASTDSTFIMDNSTCRVLGYGIGENQNIYVWNNTTSVKDIVSELAWVRTAAISGLDRAKLYYATGNRTSETDQLVMLGNVKGTDHAYYLFDGEERYDLNTTPGTAPVRKPQVIHVEGYEQFSSGAGDSTEVTVSVHDSTAVTFYYIASPGIRKRSGDTVTDMYGTIKSYSNTYGTITFIIWHKANANLSYDPTAGSLELEIQYRASFASDNGW